MKSDQRERSEEKNTCDCGEVAEPTELWKNLYFCKS